VDKSEFGELLQKVPTFLGETKAEKMFNFPEKFVK